MATTKKAVPAKKAPAKRAVAETVQVVEVQGKDTTTSAKEGAKASVYLKTGLTGGRRFEVTVRNPGKRPTMIALHL